MNAITRARPPRAEMLEWIALVGVASAEVLAHALGTSTPSARGRLASAAREGLIVGRRPLAGLPALYVPTPAGLRASGRAASGAWRVSAANALHLATCADAAGALERCYPDHAVIGECELRRAERELGRPLASARLARSGGSRSRVGSSGLHRPDLVLLPCAPHGGELPVAVEIELTVKAPRRLLAICRAWARCREVAGVLYLAAPPAERALRRAIIQCGAGSEVLVVPLAALPGIRAGSLAS